MSSYDLSLLSDDGKLEIQGHSQRQIFKTIFRIMLVRRIKSVIFWVFQVSAASIILGFMALHTNNFVNRISYFRQYFDYSHYNFGQFLSYINTDLFLFPNNKYTRKIKAQFEMYKLKWPVATIYDDLSRYETIYSNQGYAKVDINIPQNNQIIFNADIRASKPALYEFPFLDLMQQFFSQDEKTKVDIGTNTIDFQFLMEPGFCCIGCVIDVFIFFAFVKPLYEILSLRQTKQYLLLKISGAYETTILGVYFVMDIILVIIYSLMASTTLYLNIPDGSSFFFIFITIFLCIFCQYSMFIILVPITIKPRFNKYAVFFLFALASFFSAINFISTNRPLNINLVKSLLFLPQWSIAMFIENIAYCKLANFNLRFETISDGYHYIPTSLIISIVIAMTFVYLFLFFFLNIMMPRSSGIPPVGFSHIFSVKHWKRLFSFKSHNLSHREEHPFITINNISKTYKGSMNVNALDNVSFSINIGEIITLIGPNGSGKSTLLNGMSGCLNCDSGELKLFGKSCTRGFSELQHHLGICFQDNVIFDDLSVRKHLELFAGIRGVNKYEIPDLADQYLDKFCLDGCETVKAGKLSGGQMRKLCIAIAMIGNPSIVILDEPTTGIDITACQEIWKAISSFGITAIISTHSLEEAENISSRIFFLRQGQLIFDGSASELRRKYHCGYRLTPIFEDVVDAKSAKENLLNFCKTIIPSACFDETHEEDILIPVSDDIVGLLDTIEQQKSQFQLRSFNIIVEELENVLYRMYIDDEAADNNIIQT